MALEWKDKVDGEDWVLAEDINAIAHAVQEAEENKLDKITDTSLTGNFGGAYVFNADGTQGMIPITNTTDGGTIPVRETGGVVVVGTPTDDLHAANKGYVDDVADTKVIKDTSTGGWWVYGRVQGKERMLRLNTAPEGWTLPLYGTNGVMYTNDPTLSTSEDINKACTNKKYVDKAVATVQGQLDTLGTFYEVVKVYSSGTIFVDIPTGAMATAYIESSEFSAYNTDGTLVYSGTANGLTFMDENWSDISSASFTAPAYIQIPENAKQIRVDCEQMVPGDVGWDAGPIVFTGCIYFQVKRG